jgi:hypothetical protein
MDRRTRRRQILSAAFSIPDDLLRRNILVLRAHKRTHALQQKNLFDQRAQLARIHIFDHTLTQRGAVPMGREISIAAAFYWRTITKKDGRRYANLKFSFLAEIRLDRSGID